MAVQSRDEMAIDLRPVDLAVLRELSEDRATQGYLIDETPHTRSQIQRRLEVLRAADLIEKVHDGTALYGITENGREVIENDERD